VTEDRTLELLVARLSQAEARSLLLDVLGRMARRSSGIRVLVAVDALHACAADGVSPSSPGDYSGWREQQPLPNELPSVQFISRCFEDRWSAALDVAELPVPTGRRAQQRNPSTHGYLLAELATSLRLWLADSAGDDLTFRAYATWAKNRLADQPDERLPLSAPTFRVAFGSWQRTIALATNGSPRARRGRDVRSSYSDEQMCKQLAAAARSTSLGSKLTRKTYDQWAQVTFTARGVHPAHSETIRRRFGSWATALERAGLR
jgi:hypothetical protein